MRNGRPSVVLSEGESKVTRQKHNTTTRPGKKELACSRLSVVGTSENEREKNEGGLRRGAAGEPVSKTFFNDPLLV